MNLLRTLTISLIFILTLNVSFTTTYSSISNETEQEFHLLYGKTIFSLYAMGETSSFNVIYSIPPNYENQAPIIYNIMEETTAEILNFKMYNDTNSPNKVVNFTIAPLEKEERVEIHFEYWVLIKNKKYEDLPDYIRIPNQDELPKETNTWLTSTKAIQSDCILMKMKANQLLRRSYGNLRKLAENVVTLTNRKYQIVRAMSKHLIPNILYTLFPKRYPDSNYNLVHSYDGDEVEIKAFGKFFDARSVLILGGGMCIGTSNLGTALFRASGIPAKQLIVTPVYGKGENDHYTIHCISEYYCPDYGWVWAETSKKITPYEPKDYIVLRVSHPDDENRVENGRQGVGGYPLEFQILDENVIRCKRTWGWRDGQITISDCDFANNTFDITQKVWESFTKYAGRALNSDDEQHYLNAILAQKNAIKSFNQSDFYGYFENISIAYNEYQQIT